MPIWHTGQTAGAAATGAGEGAAFLLNEPVSKKEVEAVGAEKLKRGVDLAVVSNKLSVGFSVAGDCSVPLFFLLELSWGEPAAKDVSGALKKLEVSEAAKDPKGDSDAFAPKGEVSGALKPPNEDSDVLNVEVEGSGILNVVVSGTLNVVVSGILKVVSGTLKVDSGTLKGVDLGGSNVEAFPKSRLLLGKGTVSKS